MYRMVDIVKNYVKKNDDNSVQQRLCENTEKLSRLRCRWIYVREKYTQNGDIERKKIQKPHKNRNH